MQLQRRRLLLPRLRLWRFWRQTRRRACWWALREGRRSGGSGVKCPLEAQLDSPLPPKDGVSVRPGQDEEERLQTGRGALDSTPAGRRCEGVLCRVLFSPPARTSAPGGPGGTEL